MLIPLFHLTVVAVNSYVIIYDQLYIVIPMPVKEMEDLPLKSRSMLLTVWCLLLQTVYYFIAFLNDIVGTHEPTPKNPPIIRRIKDALFSLSFVTAVYVSFTFWSIYIIDKDLIFPEYIEKAYTPFFNNVMHTFIIIELLTSYRNYPSRKVGYCIMFTVYLSYISWLFVIYAKTGAWVYPVFDSLSWPARIVFLTVSLIVATMLYILGEKLNNYVCSTNMKIYGNDEPMFRPLFHLGVVVINTTCLFYYSEYVDQPLPAKGMEKYPLNGKSIYLTIWCLILQTVYHFIALLNDFVGTNAPTNSPPIIRQIKDVLFSIAFSVAVYVTATFWIMYNINPALLAPKQVFDAIPPIINQVLHTTISIFIIIELLLPHKNYPSRKFGLCLLYSSTLSYLIWFFFIYGMYGVGIYPLYEYLDIYGRIIFIVSIFIINSILYLTSEQINNFICSNDKMKYSKGKKN